MTRLCTWLAALGVLALMTSGPLEGASASTSDDLTPPVIDAVTGPPPAVRPVPIDGTVLASYSWSGHDPEGAVPVTYDLRYGWKYTASDPSSWLVALDNAPDTNWSMTLRWYDADFCIQIRARDAAGNTSAWSAPLCTVVDDGPPVAYAASDVKLFHDGLAATPVSFGYIGQDDDHVTSYDVDARVAQPGASYGPWTTPASWQGVTATSVSMKARAGSTICFRVRAHDRAGNVGEYQNPSCMAVPYDDRAFARHDGARRVRHRDTLGGSATRLSQSASLTRRHVLATSVWVRLVGPRQNVCTRVYLGSRKVALTTCSMFRVGQHTWQGFFFPRELRGKLRIRSNQGWQLIDAIGTGR